MLGGADFLIPIEARILMPYIIPFGIFGIWRWALHTIRMVCWALYRPRYPKRNTDGSSANKFKPSDVTIIVPTIDFGNEFFLASKSWKTNRPAEIIIVTTMELRGMAENCVKDAQCDCQILTVPRPNKRLQMMKGIMAANTPLVALTDDDAIWSDEFLLWMVAPFDDDNMGGVGSRQQMTSVGLFPTLWEVIADFRLSMRMIEASATTFVDGGMSCISGRTAVYRRAILTDPDFGTSFVNEKWRGKFRLHSGDDKFLTRWIVNHGWNMQMQNHVDAMLHTTFKDNSLFLKQVLRWTRNTWRSDIRSVFFERVIWRRFPYVWWNMLDKFINPLPVIYTIFIVSYNLITEARENIVYILAPVYGWIVVARFLRLIPHLLLKPSHFPYIPVMVAFQFVFPFLKIYALLTLSQTDWGTRAGADHGEDDDDYKEHEWQSDDNQHAGMEEHTDSESSSLSGTIVSHYSKAPWTKEKRTKRRVTLFIGWVFIILTLLCLGLVSYFTFETLTLAWRVTTVASNRATSSIDRATGVGMFDPSVQRTFLTYSGADLDPMVLEYDHEQNKFVNGPVAVGRAVPDFHNCTYGEFIQGSTLAETQSNDDSIASLICWQALRADPKMAMAQDGHLLVTWTDHTTSRRGSLYIAKSQFPRSSFGRWETKRIRFDSMTYQCIIKSSDGALYIFYRLSIDIDYRPLYYVKSLDNGDTWSESRKGVDSGGPLVNEDPINLNEIYYDCPRHEPAMSGRPERFAIGFTKSGGGPNITKHNHFHKDAHFVYFYPEDDTFSNVEGENLGHHVDYWEMKKTVMFDSGPLERNVEAKYLRITGYYYAPSFDDQGYPIVLYNFNRTVKSARWNGLNWNHEVVRADSPDNLFDIEKLGPSSFRAYVTSGNVFAFETFDGGRSWEQVNVFKVPGGQNITKVMRIENPHPSMQLLAMENDICAPRLVETVDDGCAQSYKGDYHVWVIGRRAIKTLTPQKDATYILNLQIVGAERMSDSEIRLCESLTAIWFVNFFKGDEVDASVAFNSPNQRRRVQRRGTDARDIETQIDFLEQRVGRNTAGEPVNMISFRQRLLYFTEPSWAGMAEGYPDFPNPRRLNLTDKSALEIIELPFRNASATEELSNLLAARIFGLGSIRSVSALVVSPNSPNRSMLPTWIGVASFCLILLVAYIWYDQRSRERFRTFRKRGQVKAKSTGSSESTTSESGSSSVDFNDEVSI